MRSRILAPRNVTDVGLALFLSTFFFIEALRMFLAGVYAMNVLTVGLNASVAAILLLLAPAAYLLGLARVPAGVGAPLFGFLFLLARVVLFVPWTVDILVAFSGLAVALYLLFLVPFLDGALRFAGGAATSASAIALALAADLALRILGRTTDPGATPWSIFYLVPLGIVFLYLLLQIPFPADPGRAPSAGSMPWSIGLGLGGFLALTTLVLVYPAFLERWNGRDDPSFAPAVLLGFCVGAYLSRIGFGSPARASRWSASLQILLGLFAIDLALAGTELLPILSFFAAVASAIGLERLLGWTAASHPTVRNLGGALTLGMVVYLLLVLAFVFTLTYAYVPLSSVWRGNAPVVLLLIAAAFLFPALAAGARSTTPVPSPASRRWTATLAATFLILASLGFAVTGEVAPRSPNPSVFRVMTYNVHQGFSIDGRLDVDRIADVVRLANPDILALEESDTVRATSGGVDLVEYIASAQGYRVAYGPPTRAQTYGVSILTRFEIRAWDYVLLTSSKDQRALVHASLVTGSTILHVFAVHLGLDGAERQIQIAQALQIASAVSGPRVLLGDFNACPSGLCPEPDATTDRVYRDVTASWEDAWTSAGHSVEDQDGYTYDSRRPYERIDYIFVSTEVSVVRCYVFRDTAPLDASDHLPLLAELSPSSIP